MDRIEVRFQRAWERMEQERLWRAQRRAYPSLRQVHGMFRRFNWLDE